MSAVKAVASAVTIGAAAFLLLPGSANAVQSLRVLVDAAPAPPPGTELVSRAAQSHDISSYFHQRESVSFNSVRGRLPDDRKPGDVPGRAAALSADDLDEVTPRMDELVLMGFDGSGSWVLLDYITDPWLVRAEFLGPSPPGKRTSTPSRYYRGNAALMLQLPAGLGLRTVDLLRPHYRGGRLMVTPVIRVLLRATED